MKEQPKIREFIKGTRFEGFLLVKNASQKTSSKTGMKFLDINFVDISGEINAKVWNSSAAAPESGSVQKVRAVVEEFNNRAQLRIDKISPAEDKDEVDMSVLIPSAPLPSDEMFGYIKGRAEAIKDERLSTLVLRMIGDVEEKLLVWPAAKAMHHAEVGGLLHHTANMLKCAQVLCGIYDYLDSDLLAAGVILHDICKLDELKCDELGLVTEYSLGGNLIGHIVMGVSRIERYGLETGLDREKLFMLEHMMLSHHGVPEYGSPKRPMFPEAEVLSTLDNLDAKLFEMVNECGKVNPGSFTECIRYMDDRKLYRRTERPEAEK